MFESLQLLIWRCALSYPHEDAAGQSRIRQVHSGYAEDYGSVEDGTPEANRGRKKGEAG